MRGIAVPQGLFIDKTVTGAPWRGQQRRTRMVVYRYVDPAQRDPYSPETALSQVCERLVSALNGAGVVAERQSGEQIHARCCAGLTPTRSGWKGGALPHRPPSRQPT